MALDELEPQHKCFAALDTEPGCSPLHFLGTHLPFPNSAQHLNTVGYSQEAARILCWEQS